MNILNIYEKNNIGRNNNITFKYKIKKWKFGYTFTCNLSFS